MQYKQYKLQDEENFIVKKITIGFNKECTDNLLKLSKVLKRNQSDTIRTAINYCYKRLVDKDIKEVDIQEEILWPLVDS